MQGLLKFYAGFTLCLQHISANSTQDLHNIFQGFTQGLQSFTQKKMTGLRRFMHGLCKVYARFTQGLCKVYARFTSRAILLLMWVNLCRKSLRRVYADFTQRAVCWWIILTFWTIFAFKAMIENTVSCGLCDSLGRTEKWGRECSMLFTIVLSLRVQI
jgi:hypothetical protein